MKDETMELIHVPGGPDDPLLTAAEYARRRRPGDIPAPMPYTPKEYGRDLDAAIQVLEAVAGFRGAMGEERNEH